MTDHAAHGTTVRKEVNIWLVDRCLDVLSFLVLEGGAKHPQRWSFACFLGKPVFSTCHRSFVAGRIDSPREYPQLLGGTLGDCIVDPKTWV